MGWIAGQITVDEGRTIVPGEFRDDYRWNGWLVPRMRFEDAEKVLRDLAEVAPDQYIVTLDGEDFIVYHIEEAAYDASEDYPYEPDVYGPDADGWYGIGAMSWCWEDATSYLDSGESE